MDLARKSRSAFSDKNLAGNQESGKNDGKNVNL